MDDFHNQRYRFEWQDLPFFLLIAFLALVVILNA